MSGHVFAVHGDIMLLACDAWVVPGDNHPGKTWRAAVEWPARVDLPTRAGERSQGRASSRGPRG